MATALTEISEDGGVRTDGDFSALAMLLVDSVLTGDEASLRVLQDWLRDERAHCADGDTAGERELQGRLLGLIDASHWAIERALPLADVSRLERGGHASRFLRELLTAPGLTNRELAARLHVDESEISRVGRRLREDGLVLRRQFGRQNRWEPTPKGRRTLELLDGVPEMEEPAGNSVDARPDIGAAIHAAAEPAADRNQWVVGAAIAILLNAGKVDMDDLRREVADVADVRVEVADQAVQQLVRNNFLTSRASRVVTLNERRASAIGVRVTPAEVVGVLTGPVGNELTSPRRRRLSSTDVATVVGSITALVADVLEHSDQSAEAVVGLGVELAGHVNGRIGSVVFSPDLMDSGDYWRHVPLRMLLEEATGLPTVVENDANALALNEQLFGLGRDVSDFAAVLLGLEGVGCGLVVGGTLAHGSEGIAGELGHLIVDPDGDKCRCGNRGCLETVVSVTGIRRMMSRTAPAGIEDPFSMIGRQGYDEVVAGAFSRAGDALGLGLSSVLNLVNPARVIVFGPPMLTATQNPSAQVFMNSVRSSAERYSFSFAGHHYDLEFRPFDDISGPKGAAAAVISRLVGRRMRLVAAGRREGPGRLEPEYGSHELAHRLMAEV